MNKKIITHTEVMKELDKKWPGFRRKVKAEADRLHIAYRIAQLRQRSRMSQKELAERIGTTQSVVSRMESSNYVDYRVSTLKRIADATGGSFVISATR